ncbi:MAG: four helix bundle protein [Chitinophagales bacterium]|nr:four helix bundle protein [Chitinophagales bacterium]
MKNFRKYSVWQEAMVIVDDVYGIVDGFPKSENFGMRSQVTRAAVSVASNIAEGCSRSSQIDFKRFLQISMGSLFELETQLLIINNRNWVDENKVIQLIDKVIELEKRLGALIRKIKEDTAKS